MPASWGGFAYAFALRHAAIRLVTRALNAYTIVYANLSPLQELLPAITVKSGGPRRYHSCNPVF